MSSSAAPEGEKLAPQFKGVLNAEETRSTYGDGVFGGAYQADDEIMQEIFDAAVKDVLFELEF